MRNVNQVTTVMVSDPAMQGFVGASHVAEVRTAVNAVRALAGLAAASFTDANLTGVVWRAVHIEELRNALTAARAQLALPAVSYTDPGSLVGLLFKTAYVTDLRGGVQ